MKILVKVYNASKYVAESKKIAEVLYENVIDAEVKEYTDSEIESMGFDEVDPNGEYFVVTHEDGEMSTFRNSFIDAFEMRQVKIS